MWADRWRLTRYLYRRMVPEAGELSLVVSGMRVCLDDPHGDLGPLVEVVAKSAYEQRVDFIGAAESVVVDAGANVGFYTVRQALRGSRVIAFEPNHEAFQRLMHHLKINHVEDRVVALNIGLSERSGRGNLVTLGGKSYTSYLGPSNESGREVEVLTLDEALENQGVQHVDILKVDVEGHEELLFRGAGVTLSRTSRVVVERHLPISLDKILGPKGFDRLPTSGDPYLEYFVRRGL